MFFRNILNSWTVYIYIYIAGNWSLRMLIAVSVMLYECEVVPRWKKSDREFAEKIRTRNHCGGTASFKCELKFHEFFRSYNLNERDSDLSRLSFILRDSWLCRCNQRFFEFVELSNFFRTLTFNYLLTMFHSSEHLNLYFHIFVVYQIIIEKCIFQIWCRKNKT